MKRIFILLTAALLAVGLFAEEAVLIDFTKLGADIIPAPQQGEQEQQMTQNRATIMDYGAVSGGSFTQEQKRIMKTSLAIKNWTVILNSSARTVNREVLTYAEEAQSKQYGTVMGVRVNFPTEPWNANAVIKPPFEIPAYEPVGQIDDEGNVTGANTNVMSLSRFEGPLNEETGKPAYGLGVIKNVGTIKSVAVNVYGLQFPHSLSVILIDNEGTEKTMFVDYLNFDGWAELTWQNPAYVQEVRNRELRLYPLYPTSTPFIKFGGFLVKRDGDQAGGDFIAYFRDVKVIYDKAVLDTDRDIDDEGLWHIIQTREEKKKQWEMSRFGQQQILRYLEQQKQATENSFTPSPTTGGDGAAAN
ncbi:flagellar filament outer layer protein [Spirochaetia bacterium]|nr:flagellar filament outer layer protein [Spirochaetia bacterium]